jgi:hypothetical protein
LRTCTRAILSFTSEQPAIHIGDPIGFGAIVEGMRDIPASEMCGNVGFGGPERNRPLMTVCGTALKFARAGRRHRQVAINLAAIKHRLAAIKHRS